MIPIFYRLNNIFPHYCRFHYKSRVLNVNNKALLLNSSGFYWTKMVMEGQENLIDMINGKLLEQCTLGI